MNFDNFFSKKKNSKLPVPGIGWGGGTNSAGGGIVIGWSIGGCGANNAPAEVACNETKNN